MQAKNEIIKWYNPVKLLFLSFFASLNVFLVICFIVSAYSGAISPEKNLFFAYLNLAFPILLFINLGFFIYWVVVKNRLMIFILTMAFAACWIPFSHYCPFHIETKILPRDNLIKVLSYNVMSFAYKDHTDESPNKIIRYIAESNADIVCLQEYLVSERPDLMNSRNVAKALPMYPYIAETVFSSPKKRYKFGLAVLSKFPITKSRRINIQSAYNGASVHEINVKGRRVVLFNNHLESFKLTAEDRSRYSDVFSGNLELIDGLRGGPIRQKLGEAFRIRAGQAEMIAEEIRRENGYYTIVCGDFNDTPISYVHRVIQGPLVDAYAESGFGMGNSYNQNFFLFRIDHIFHSPGLKAYNCRVDKRVNLSDHYPICCYLSFD
jgi:endonuclease/exonuclease/phosphatase family metal-dependent hydrolase